MTILYKIAKVLFLCVCLNCILYTELLFKYYYVARVDIIRLVAQREDGTDDPKLFISKHSASIFFAPRIKPTKNNKSC